MRLGVNTAEGLTNCAIMSQFLPASYSPPPPQLTIIPKPYLNTPQSHKPEMEGQANQT